MKTKLFHLAIRYISCETSFCMAANIISCTYKVMSYPSLHFCTRHHVNSFVRVVYAINLQHIFDILWHLWAFSLALDSTTHQSTSYLDLCICVYVEEHHTITNLHGCALLVFQWHTSEVMFKMVSNFLIVLCPDWKIRTLGLFFNGARNMTRCVVGIVTQPQDSMHDDCSLFCI
jgi:hypothetical protein